MGFLARNASSKLKGRVIHPLVWQTKVKQSAVTKSSVTRLNGSKCQGRVKWTLLQNLSKEKEKFWLGFEVNEGDI